MTKDLIKEKQGKFIPIQDKPGKCLTEELKILNRWIEYFSDLYNFETHGNTTALDFTSTPDEEPLPILREEVEASVEALKVEKTAGVDNLQIELYKAEGAGKMRRH